jgi:hypothetical protein
MQIRCRFVSGRFSIEASHLKICRLGKGIEDFNVASLNIVTISINAFFAIGSSIIEILHPKSQDQFLQSFLDSGQKLINNGRASPFHRYQPRWDRLQSFSNRIACHSLFCQSKTIEKQSRFML